MARAAGAAYAGTRDHPFPTCFVCGPRRDPGDGLRLAPGRVPGRSTDTAAVWVPDPSLDGGSGRVDVAACWAALDCPGGWALDLVGRPMVLGTMTAQVRKLPRIGGRYAVVGRVVRTEGRKAYTETALYDLEGLDVPLGGPVLEVATDPADGRSGASVPLARAAAVWLRVDPASIRPA